MRDYQILQLSWQSSKRFLCYRTLTLSLEESLYSLIRDKQNPMMTFLWKVLWKEISDYSKFRSELPAIWL